MLLTFLMLLGAIPFIKKGGKNLPGELGSGMAFSLAFLLGGGYMLALFHLWRLALLPAVLLLIFSLCSVLKRRTFWKGKYDFFAEKLADSARNKNMELPGMALFFLLFTAAFLYLWFLACEKELPCGWDPAFHAILAGKILKEGTLSTTWMPFENIPMNYPQGSHVLIALTAKYGALCRTLPEGLSGVPQAQKLLMFALVLPSALLLWGIAQETFHSFSAGFHTFLVYTFLGNIGTYSSFWCWGGYPTAVGFLFFSALVCFAMKKGNWERSDFAACTVLWGSFGLCHHMTVVIVFFIMLFFSFFAPFRKEALQIWKRLVFPGVAACIVYLPGILFQLKASGTLDRSEVFRFEDDAPFTFLKTLEDGHIPLVLGFAAMAFFLLYKRKEGNAKRAFVVLWALAGFGGFFLLDVVFRNCIAVPLYGRNFTLFVPSRFLTMATLPLSILTGGLLACFFRSGALRKQKLFPALFILGAAVYGCVNFTLRTTGEAPSAPSMTLASKLAGLDEKAFVIVNPARTMKSHWLPFFLWKPCITNPIPSSEDRRNTRMGLHLFLFTPWEKLDIPAIRQFLKARGDQKAYWVVTDDTGNLVNVFRHPAD